ncbi:MAG: envelope stress response membrane protein PspC [Planctomycetota bacterium]|jgi:phage shock protein C|nr:envelope stress response membrane protein PspC [Planctomycetota bacterium]MDP6358064.1 envelope stress response membrane protein PspC [Planctomycetota bacterium]MDP7253234.1 envelope stress response membrane protein PspC [Planctomycetota bacterium]|tara:strand:- start:81 stop:470 length:390 start_codon:yes stop_codon:yes gene_type:complete
MNSQQRRQGLYRSRGGIIMGVCQGIAEHWDFSVFWTRLVFVLTLLFTGFWPVVAIYFLAALLMKPEPVMPFTTDGDQEFYDSYVSSRTLALRRLKRVYDNLMRRIERMEDMVTAREYEWDKKFNEGKEG